MLLFGDSHGVMCYVWVTCSCFGMRKGNVDVMRITRCCESFRDYIGFRD